MVETPKLNMLLHLDLECCCASCSAALASSRACHHCQIATCRIPVMILRVIAPSDLAELPVLYASHTQDTILLLPCWSIDTCHDTMSSQLDEVWVDVLL